jgi:hypothetical protein
MDSTFFAAAHLPRLMKFWWRENRYYAEAQTSTSTLAFVLNRMLELGNAVAYLESRLLAKRSLAAAGMLFDARRAATCYIPRMARSRTEEPRFVFATTPAVTAARSHNRYVVCPACQADIPTYLFHRTGVRFVRCAACAAVYVNPAREQPINNFDVEKLHPFANPRDRELMVADLESLLERVADDHQRVAGAPLRRTLLLGRYLPEFAQVPSAQRIGLEVAQPDDAAFRKLALDSDLSWCKAALAKQPQVVILQELLESCANPGASAAAEGCSNPCGPRSARRSQTSAATLQARECSAPGFQMELESGWISEV